jgi:predicted MPP superfamily phosphohydrolase
MPSRTTGGTARASRSKRLRARLRHTGFVRIPLWLTRGRLSRLRSLRRLHLAEHQVVLPELPPALDGLRITHLSDLHVGDLFRPEKLAVVVRAANGMRGDLIAVTGDFVDLRLDVLDAVIAALHQLHAPLGVFLVPGNHDYLENGPELLRRLDQAGLRLLLNQTVDLRHQGALVRVAGIDYAPSPRQLAHLVQRVVHDAPRWHGPGLRLLLSHHPDAFDAAGRHGFDLTLAGHTHGGQLLLSNRRGRKGSIGLGSLAFQYPRGLYRRGDRHLFVNSGIGSWFPWRVRCPAEIACLTLRRKAIIPLTSKGQRGSHARG